MLINTKAAIHWGSIVLGIIVVNFPILPSNAQSTTADSFNFEDISAGEESNWNFSSEDETASMRDNLKELGEYNISGSENFDVRLIEGSRRGANKNDRPNYYYIENRVDPYYTIKTRVFDY